MKWKLLFFFPTILFLATPAYAHSQTHSLDTSTLHFKLDNDSRIKFDADTIYLGNSNGLWTWVDDDAIRFYNLRMSDSHCPSPWTLTTSASLNVTVTTLFEDNELTFELAGTEGEPFTLEFDVDDWPDQILQSGAVVEGWTVDAGVLHVSDELRCSPTTLDVLWGNVEEPPHGSPPSKPPTEPPSEAPPVTPPFPIPTEYLIIGLVALGGAALYLSERRKKTAPDLWSLSRRVASKMKAPKRRKVKEPKWPKGKKRKRRWKKREEDWE